MRPKLPLGTVVVREEALQKGEMLLSRYRTLRGHKVFVATFSGRGEEESKRP
jgi:hypothetical protein